jgi:hypothetical protein
MRVRVKGRIITLDLILPSKNRTECQELGIFVIIWIARLECSFAGETGLVWAGADLLVDDCLIEIKASVEPTVRSIWLRNHTGCVLLDYEDWHHIHSVGIYMARQRLLLNWPLDDFFGWLIGESHPDLASLRQEFRICRESVPHYLYL